MHMCTSIILYLVQNSGWEKLGKSVIPRFSGEEPEFIIACVYSGKL